MLEKRLLNTQYLEDPQQIAGIREDWLKLALEVESCPAYATYSWYHAWQAVFGGNKRHGIFVSRAGERIVGIRSMMLNRVWRGPALSAQYDYTSEDTQFLSQQPKFRLLPVQQISSLITLESANFRDTTLTAPGFAAETDQSWLETLTDMPGWNIARLPCPAHRVDSLLQQAAAVGLSGFARKSCMPIYHMQLMSYKELAEKRSRNFRKQIGRAIDRAHELPGGYHKSAFVGRSEAVEGLSLLYHIADKSWKAHGRNSESLYLPPTAKNRDFFQRLCYDKDSEFTPYIQILFDGKQPFAGALTLLHKDRVFGALTFYDPSYSQLYPGRLLFVEMIDQAWQLGGRTFDLNGGSSFMEYFADGAEQYHQLMIFNPRVYSRFLYKLAHRFSKDILVHADVYA